ncbi:endonuclease III domain-containing protein [Aspergillus aculeatinus CBS 121060]|uniref:DNA glycosylase n=1 Tax=Aspergillus aculeatinus CBS 121060 TaxID=1448322 RepID=A0ACD1GYV8_9EURO|nr:DNA glycosylase [Aspergillus aculeatinus CBS 121060]RAH66662.1 DNA glycosylase [Aspergillus aculeatinus CBS 121060]
MVRITRSTTARQAALAASQAQSSNSTSSQVPSVRLSTTSPSQGRNRSQRNSPLQVKAEDAIPEPPPKRRKRNNATTPPQIKDLNDLPHNLGAVISPTTPTNSRIKSSASVSPIKKEGEAINNLAKDLQTTVDKATLHNDDDLSPPRKKPPAKAARAKAKANQYGLTPGVSPFPDWPHPTPDECEEVDRLLSSIHGRIVAPATIPEPSLTVTGCGEVPSVLDALIRTLLSGATTGNNSAMAFNGLVQRFGILREGIGKGSVDWDAVRRAPVREVFEAIKRGGLADVKSKKIKAILDMVYEENKARRDLLVGGGGSDADADADAEGEASAATAEGVLNHQSEGHKNYEIACADQNFLNLNHLHTLSTERAMTELVKYPGIGPKTAGCVLLFCLQRPCFAVDTHIFRICKWLGWVPPSKVTEVTAFGHLEVRIPDHLKYSLHQLLIRHGKSCPRCRAITGQSSARWEEGCVIDHLVKRTGKRKGGV